MNEELAILKAELIYEKFKKVRLEVNLKMLELQNTLERAEADCLVTLTDVIKEIKK